MKYSKDLCTELLIQMQKRLEAQGESRYPKRSDFSEDEVAAIKSFLGPWPRALEQAGVKLPRDDGKSERIRQKRIEIKRRKTQSKKEKV